MASEIRYDSLYEVIESFMDWDATGQAEKFGLALSDIARKYVIAASGDTLSEVALQREMCEVLHHSGGFRACFAESLRRLVVRYHARNISTTTAVKMILLDDLMCAVTPFYTLKCSNLCGFDNIKSYLVSRVGYLKCGHPRWPHKYDELWREERQDYVDEIKNIPLSQPAEQLQKLTEHYHMLEEQFVHAQKATDKERYHKCMIRTMAGIHAITNVPNITAKHLALSQEDVIDVPAETTVAAPKP